jgi:hypothetical protein
MGDRLLHGGCTVAPAVRQRENEWALEVAKMQDLRIDKSVREREHLGGWNSIGASYAEELAANHPARKLPPSNRMFTSGPHSVCGELPIHSRDARGDILTGRRGYPTGPTVVESIAASTRSVGPACMLRLCSPLLPSPPAHSLPWTATTLKISV